VSAWQALATCAAATLVLYALIVVALALAGRADAARALARFVPDCIVLFRRLLADPRVGRRTKVVLGALIAYLALPFDLVPDFIPVAGYVDDAVIVAIALRHIVRASGNAVIEEHWPGTANSLEVLLRLTASGGHREQGASDSWR
jgi:uncharacterized membrane protein YkvA (DUF1232 family)